MRKLRYFTNVLVSRIFLKDKHILIGFLKSKCIHVLNNALVQSSWSILKTIFLHVLWFIKRWKWFILLLSLRNKSLGRCRRRNNCLSLNVMMMSFSFMRALLFDFFFVAFERDSWGFSWDEFSTESYFEIDYMLTCYWMHKTYSLIYSRIIQYPCYWKFWFLISRL